MVGISHFITWHVAVERQCYIHFTICRRAPPPSFLICLTLSKQGTCLVWGVCVCMYKYICVRVCVRVCDFAPHFLAIFWQYEVGIPFFCKTPPPLNFFLLWLFTTVFSGIWAWYISICCIMLNVMSHSHLTRFCIIMIHWYNIKMRYI